MTAVDAPLVGVVTIVGRSGPEQVSVVLDGDMAKKRVEAAVETLVESGVVTEDQLVHAAEVVKVLATLRGIEVGETGVRKPTSKSGSKKKRRRCA